MVQMQFVNIRSRLDGPGVLIAVILTPSSPSNSCVATAVIFALSFTPIQSGGKRKFLFEIGWSLQLLRTLAIKRVILANRPSL